jgi:parvulin-like peptidyl-prolyl isomerase
MILTHIVAPFLSQEAQETKELEERIRALELGGKFDATKAEVERLETEYLLKLREIRAALTNGNNQAGAVDSKELQALREENGLLKKKNAKLEYRVKHVVSELDTLYQERKKVLSS